jgi:hypothetical protein
MLRRIAIALAAASLFGTASIPTGAQAVALGYGAYSYGAYSYYDDPCYAWTPYGYTRVCGYDY